MRVLHQIRGVVAVALESHRRWHGPPPILYDADDLGSIACFAVDRSLRCSKDLLASLQGRRPPLGPEEQVEIARLALETLKRGASLAQEANSSRVVDEFLETADLYADRIPTPGPLSAFVSLVVALVLRRAWSAKPRPSRETAEGDWRRSFLPPNLPLDEGVHPEGESREQSDLKLDIEMMLSKFPLPDREVLSRRIFQGLTLEGLVSEDWPTKEGASVRLTFKRVRTICERGTRALEDLLGPDYSGSG